MEGLLNLAHEFLRDQGARARAQEVDRARESRIGTMRAWFEAFGRGELALADLAARISAALRETALVRGMPLLLWGFKNDDERLFPERLAAAAARAPEVDLQGVLVHLLSDLDAATDDERVNRLLAFADFVADLDGRGNEGDPRLGVGPSANFLTFAWHVLTLGREAVFLFDSNKAIKSVAEASQDPQLQARDLEGRFRAFYLVAGKISEATKGNQPAIRPGWAVEHVLEYVLERTGAVGQVAANLAAEDASQSGLWRPRSRAEVRLRPPSGRLPEGGKPAGPRSTITIERPKTRALDPGSTEAAALAAAPSSASPASPAPASAKLDRTDRPEEKPDRFMGLSKAKTIMADSPHSGPLAPADAPPLRAEPPQSITTRGLPRITARASAAGSANAPGASTGMGATGATTSSAGEGEAPPSPPLEGAAPVDLHAWVQSIAPPPPIATPTSSNPGVSASPNAPPSAEEHDGHSEPSTPALPTARATIDRSSKVLSQELVQQAVGELIGEIATAEAEPGSDESAHAEDATWRSDRLARDLAVSEVLLSDALDALATRGRLLLAGPLATGKSYIARRLALQVASRDDRIVQLRCHPGLGYDELVDATLPDGEVKPGVVRELLERARKDREGRYALVLDDVDRTDLGRALGELMPALSERGAEVLLTRSRIRLAIPKNLVVIATARSVPLDLLGRFPVVEAAPDEQALRRFLQRTRPSVSWAADVLREANSRILRERGPGARLGHGLLMDPELDNARLEGIWRREVLPIIRALGLDPRSFEIATLRKA